MCKQCVHTDLNQSLCPAGFWFFAPPHAASCEMCHWVHGNSVTMEIKLEAKDLWCRVTMTWPSFLDWVNHRLNSPTLWFRPEPWHPRCLYCVVSCLKRSHNNHNVQKKLTVETLGQCRLAANIRFIYLFITVEMVFFSFVQFEKKMSAGELHLSGSNETTNSR